LLNLANKTDRELRKSLTSHQGNADSAETVVIGGIIFFGIGLTLSLVLVTGGALIIGMGVLLMRNSEKRADECQREIDRRPVVVAALPAPSSNPPSVTKEFNPAAAVVLENDMRSMAPLRLRKRGFSHG
jgi:hypothetical protein